MRSDFNGLMRRTPVTAFAFEGARWRHNPLIPAQAGLQSFLDGFQALRRIDADREQMNDWKRREIFWIPGLRRGERGGSDESPQVRGKEDG